jgi:hypothetical protein
VILLKVDTQGVALLPFLRPGYPTFCDGHHSALAAGSLNIEHSNE